MTPLPLNALGQRIMVMGPSNAGKSTLATAIGRRLELPIVHLDQLNHLPNTDWVPDRRRNLRLCMIKQSVRNAG